ncbi:MAG: hypothetical protein JWN66_2585 [Sphingomonas bacterium]|uniref:hypothetical protein n=1 Tax=Sphingomonas bacterium TaxID=1895847 RepID=UPI002628343E|nr:hypothetical protein [Sphingomonas bacterium]MDB5705469.1 hypothetical protein [Sphingomonas bacterium]
MEHHRGEHLSDDFDWAESLGVAGNDAPLRSLSHMTSADIAAPMAAEQEAAVSLAYSIGLPQKGDEADQPIPVEMSDETAAAMLEAVNAVTISPEHLKRVMRIVDVIPVPLKYAGAAPAYSALECAGDLGLDEPAARALLARAIALSRWRSEGVVREAKENPAVIEAAARAAVTMSGGLPAFEAPAFVELIAFITDLPW